MTLVNRLAGLLLLGSAAVLAVAAAEAAPLGASRTGASEGRGMVAAVSDRYEGRRYRRYRGDRYDDYYDGRVVEAPYTYVEPGYRARVAVDAPFAGVRVGRRGVWVRAPFVDLYVPR